MRQKTLTSLWWVIRLQFKSSKLYFVWSTFFSLFQGIVPVLNVYVVAKLITSVTAVAFQHASSKDVYVWLAILLVLEIFGSLFRNINRLAEKRFQQRIELVATERFFTKLYQLSQEQFDNQEFNTKVSLAENGLHQLWRILNELSWGVSSCINFLGAIGAVFLVSPWVGAIISATVIPMAVLRSKQNKLSNNAYKVSEPFVRIASRSSWMLFEPSTMPEIRVMNALKNLASSWRTNIKKSQDIMYKAEKKLFGIDLIADTLPPIVNFFANLYFFQLLVAGTLGLDRFIFLRGILEQASSTAGYVASSIDRLHELTINLNNFSEVDQTLPAIPNGTIKVEKPLTIEFKDVHFAYPGTNQSVLHDISFLIVPGSNLALVGENGAGKTTLIKLLLRQYLPTSGTITVNGHNIGDIDQVSYYAALSNLSQDFLVVSHLTIKDNLTLGLDRVVPDKEILEITTLVEADEFIDKLPHKINQRLDNSFDDGSGLSGGQLQRIGVARALLRQGDIMLLDEPTSAIDAKAEYAIFNNIYKAHANKTTLIVSHRFSTVRKADKIIVLEHGTITEYGSHEELLQFGGLYKEMFEAQAEGYK